MRDGDARETSETHLSLTEERVLSHETLEAQPSIAIEEFIACEQTVTENGEWQAVLRERDNNHECWACRLPTDHDRLSE